MTKDELGNRMKGYYEDRFRYQIPRRSYTIIRIDGRAFHTYTKGTKKPFDQRFMDAMDKTTVALCNQIQGAKFAYVQSDEISILITDFDSITTEAWFDNNIQKMCSVAASIATVEFNLLFGEPFKATFDARVFQLPSAGEVENYFIWRQQDAVKNSISSQANFLYKPKETHLKKSGELQEMIFQKGINWNDLAPRVKRGDFVSWEEVQVSDRKGGFVIRKKFKSIGCPIFTQDRTFLQGRIPLNT